MLDENLALSRAQLESLRKLQSEQAQAAANLRKLETEKNAEMAKLDAEIARLRQQAQQPGQSGSSLDQIVALGRKRKAAAEELAAAQRKAEEERQKREAEIAQVKAVARAKRKAEFEAAYATYQEAVELADKGYLGAAEHQAAWQTICGDFGVKNPGDKPASLAWNDTDGTVQLALPDSANDAKLSSSFQFASVASFFASKNITNTVDYVVQRGDSLGSIANGHKTTVELIQVLNNIRTPNTIKIGDRLRVFNGEFNVDIHYPEAQLIIVLDGNLFWKYKIRVGSSTISPVGSFVIAAKVAEPTWWPPSGHEIPFGHPDNVLGSRWISLRATGSTPDIRGFGIHGTWTPLTKTDKSLSGLVEMNNTDVEEIFTYLPVGTQVRLHN
jgi:LysM repeat protein